MSPKTCKVITAWEDGDGGGQVNHERMTWHVMCHISGVTGLQGSSGVMETRKEESCHRGRNRMRRGTRGFWVEDADASGGVEM